MKRVIFVVLVGFVASLFLTSQFSSFEGMGERRFATLAKPSKVVTVGVSWPFSVNKDGTADGLTLALEEIRRDHLAGAFDIKLVIRDDELDWDVSKAIADEFASTPDMSAVIGYYDDAPAVKASAIFESAKLLHVITGANNTAMTERGFQYIVRTVLSSGQIASELTQKMAGIGYRKYALIWDEDAYGEDLAYQARVDLDAIDLPVVFQWSYARERADFRWVVNELKGVDADVVFFAGLEPWAGDFLHAARDVGLKTPIVGAFSDTPEMRARAGTAIEGSMYFDLYDPGSSRPESVEFVRKFKARFGKTPDTWAAQAYDALILLAKAIKFTGSRNPLDLSYAIRYMDPWEGANGRYKFTRSGEVETKPVFLKIYRNGKPETLD